MSTEIISATTDAYMPVMGIEQAVVRRNSMVEFVKRVMVEGIDFGVIPGASKPSLQKPGAEKLLSLFGLTPRFHCEAERDWTGAAHGGEAFFHFHYKCQLWRGDVLMGEGEGSCNSWETKYRYRQGERKCPNCGKETIRKSKPRDGDRNPPGWYCWSKLGGCGAQFKAGDEAIEGQQVGRVINPDPADLVNTIAKMAQKRALVAACLITVNASEFFTQDIEDFTPGETYEPPRPASYEPPRPSPAVDAALAPLQARVKALREAERAYVADPPAFAWNPKQGPAPLVAEINASRRRIIAALGSLFADEQTADEDLITEVRAAREREFAAIEEATQEG